MYDVRCMIYATNLVCCTSNIIYGASLSTFQLPAAIFEY